MTKFNKPGPNKRVCAYLIDAALIIIIQRIISLPSTFSSLIFITYFLFRDSFSGQSLGKMFVSLEVIDEKGKRTGLLPGMLRNLPFVLPDLVSFFLRSIASYSGAVLIVLGFVPLVEYFVMRTNKEGRRIGDRIAKTKVNDLKPQTSDLKYLWISLAVMVVLTLISNPNVPMK